VEYYSFLLVQLKYILKEQRRGKITKVVLFLATPTKLAYLRFQSRDHGPGPDGLSPVPWTEKRIEMSPFFFRTGSHCCRGDLVGRKKFRFFFSSLPKLEQRAKKCIELRGEYVE